MAEHGISTEGEHGRHPGALQRDRRVPDGVNPSMDRVKLSGSNPIADGAIADSDLPQLAQRDHPMLPRGSLSHRHPNPPFAPLPNLTFRPHFRVNVRFGPGSSPGWEDWGVFELLDVSLERGGALVLDSITAGIPEGTTAVVGPSGAGKSTLLRLLNRLADPDSGEILYLDRPLVSRDPLELRRQVSLVPQLPALLGGTVESNLAFAAGLAGRDLDAGRCLTLAGLEPTFAERDVARLSVGEQQRAMLARSLAQEPRVLLLDEPTSALDEASRDAIETTFVHLRRETGISIVLVTHDPAQARRLGDYVVRLESGRVVQRGPVEEVLA